MRSLGLRLFLIAALAIGVALVSVALLTRQAVRTEFSRFELSEHVVRVEGAAGTLARRLGAEADRSRLDATLEELGRSERRDLLLIGPDGAVRSASRPELKDATVRMLADGSLAIEGRARRGAAVALVRAVVIHPPSAAVRTADGRLLGTLIMLPPAGREAPLHGPFGVAFDLRLLIAALAAGLVALALTWLAARRVLEPVGALTRAARALGRGDLASRVPVRSSDEIGELSRAFNAMAEDLARQEALRRTMVSDVAHELRSPLTNLRCQIEAVEDGLLPVSPETVRSLREEVLLLSRLVEDLQTVSVAEAGKLALERAPVALRDLVDGALESFRAIAAERRLALTVDMPELPMVDVDPTRIAQVLRNLLANAVRATPDGGAIAIAARASGREVAVEVRDSGAGIAPEHLPHLFERFYRADPSRARATGGAGLGLAIVKGIVEAHGGTVGVDSEPGHGARFRFTLPLA
ncbi:MAG: HAMP domain-containing protein [Candidatus Eisenbacteria bacterium]|nr:HAMP domain-containing protein [Candidatus Eisenbacteria bacterium]